MKNVIISLTALTCLGACGGSKGADSGLLASDGSFLTPLNEAAIRTDNFAGTNNGYVFQVGLNDSRSQFATEAALLDGTNLPSPDPVGGGEMTATYQFETFQFPVTDDTGLTGTRLSRSGDMTLTVDFENGTLSGDDNGLAIAGTFGPTGELTGTARYEDMSGGLIGDVSNTQAVGIFDGQSVTGVFAGGFIAE